MSASIAVQMAKLRGAQMGNPMGDEPEQGTTTRPPSTALLSVDSLDRVQTVGEGTSGNFLINKKQALFNGFFNRIALNEIVLEWCIPNVSGGYSPANNSITIDLVPGPGSYTVTIPDGTYTVAQCLDAVVRALNDAGAFGAGAFVVWDATGAPYSASVGGLAYLHSTLGNFSILPGALQGQLGLALNPAGQNNYPLVCPRLTPIYYLDFVSPQLTYNQDLKDNTTSVIQRDTLYRWVLSYDNVPLPLDKYDYPIYQGYKPFVSRRYLSFPKQILWNPAMPVGQLTFQVYTSGGELLDPTALGGEMEYQMALLFSEN
jgi:hypothetical protein